MAGELVVREARPGDARAVAEVSVASRRWSYRDLVAETDLEALSVEETIADFAEGLAELPPGATVFVAELTGRVVGSRGRRHRSGMRSVLWPSVSRSFDSRSGSVG